MIPFILIFYYFFGGTKRYRSIYHYHTNPISHRNKYQINIKSLAGPLYAASVPQQIIVLTHIDREKERWRKKTNREGLQNHKIHISYAWIQIPVNVVCTNQCLPVQSRTGVGQCNLVPIQFPIIFFVDTSQYTLAYIWSTGTIPSDRLSKPVSYWDLNLWSCDAMSSSLVSVGLHLNKFPVKLN